MKFEICEIDHGSFTEAGCNPRYTDADLPFCIEIPTDRGLRAEDYAAPTYRSDAAAGGILAHSPYCECGYPS
jgi:hypothetical protein